MEKHNQNDSFQPLKSSCEIIKEAKASLTPSIMNTRIVKTNRPFTPRNNQRILFEEKRNDRPTSSVRLFPLYLLPPCTSIHILTRV